MISNYDVVIPKNIILFNLRQIEEMGLIKIDMAKKLIAKKELEIVKIGNRVHISRQQLIHYLEANTIKAVG